VGTSVNQRSPDTPPWILAQDAYTDASMPVNQALREVWRAASNETETNLMSFLVQPELTAFADLAARISTPSEAFQETSRFISDQKVASLVADIARRAVIQSAGVENPRQQFLQRLFAEATNYLVSRDLPGHIRPGGKIETVSDARRFTQAMMDTTADAVRRTPEPPVIARDTWPTYVRSVVQTIRRRQE
jgi:hypothetical protein